MNKYKTKIRTFLMLFISGLLFLNISLFADDLRVIREKTFSVKQGETLSVDASGAHVKVESWNKDEVYVKILGNKRAEEKLEFNLEQSSHGVKVTAKKKGWSFFNWGGGIRLKIEVMMPANYNNDISTSGGDINIASVNGKFELHTSGGDVSLLNTNGELKAHTSGGDIKLNKHRGGTDLSTSGGDIQCKTHAGDIKASTSGGDVELEVSDGRVMAKTSGGDVKIYYTGNYKGIRANTSGGDIRLSIPASSTASVHLETSGGSINCDFQNSKSTKVSRGELRTELNGGGETLIAKTSGGNISLKEN
jgi:DUF4097 and DUF4098 domain-containing protein YvlB